MQANRIEGDGVMETIEEAHRLAQHLATLLPKHQQEDLTELCERVLFMLRYPKANPLRGLVPSDMGALGCARD